MTTHVLSPDVLNDGRTDSARSQNPAGQGLAAQAAPAAREGVPAVAEPQDGARKRRSAPQGDPPAGNAASPNWAEAIIRATLPPLLTFGVVLGIWAFISAAIVPDIPGPGATFEHAKEVLADPFYQAGPNDMGIGWQVLFSLSRVLSGFALAALVGIPLGLLIGMSQPVRRALGPLIQILRPVSPLAWLPIGLLLFKAVNPSAVFVIFITSIWPIILNTAAGVQAIPQDYLNVAKVLQLGRWDVTRKILLPATRPHIMTGMRLSLGIGWMVIVAAEMLTGGIGIGFYVWDEWNNLNVASIIVAIGIIGLVGILLETVMDRIQRRFDYTRGGH
ncbi:MAG: nitrate ABC transporter permease [Nitrospirae bacterium]|nr:nitrate ABC transporter permease [Nitrospirota bacterium]